MSFRNIAILIDGGFFLKRLPHLVKPEYCATPEGIVAHIRHLCRNHVKYLTACGNTDWNQHVYRIFYYGLCRDGCGTLLPQRSLEGRLGGWKNSSLKLWV